MAPRNNEHVGDFAAAAATVIMTFSKARRCGCVLVSADIMAAVRHERRQSNDSKVQYGDPISHGRISS